jgi:glycosyltransferase involved in cell wall biosynthesis
MLVPDRPMHPLAEDATLMSEATQAPGGSVASNAAPDLVFISWAPFCSRSDSIAGRLGGRSYMVYSAHYGSNYLLVGFKYLSQMVKTLRILWRERPSVVFVMTPPVVACLPAWLYASIAGGSFVIDAHSGALLDPRWRRVLFLHRWFSRAALTTIVTNEHMQSMVESWGGHATLMRDVPVCFAEPSRPNLPAGCNMTLVSTFTWDEPIDLFFEAAARVPDITFHVTGNARRADPRLLARKPPNVRLTGFLPDADYAGLLAASDAVIALTTADHTMQRGAYEAVYLGRPVITSNFGLLRRHFWKGAVHVDNNVESIVDGMVLMRSDLPRFQREVTELRAERLREWTRVEADLRALMA